MSARRFGCQPLTASAASAKTVVTIRHNVVFFQLFVASCQKTESVAANGLQHDLKATRGHEPEVPEFCTGITKVDRIVL
jgi:hypothetical protein